MQKHQYTSAWSYLNSRAQREKVLKVDRLGERQPNVINICRLIAAGDAQNRRAINKKPLSTADIRTKVYPILNEKRPLGVCYLIKETTNSLLQQKRIRNANKMIEDMKM